MRILSLFSEMPRLPGPGAASRVFCMMRELSRKHSFTLVTTQIDQRAHIPALEAAGVRVEMVEPARAVPGAFARLLERNYRARMLRGILFGKPAELALHPETMARLKGRITDLLREKYDLLEVHHAWCARWIEGVRVGVPMVAVLYDAMSQVYRRACERKEARLDRLEARALRRRAAAFERRALCRFNVCAVPSEATRAALLDLAPGTDVRVVPNGVDTGFFAPRSGVDIVPRTIVFTGAMSYLPNRDAVAWFCARVLPCVVARFPGARFTAMGPDPTPSLLSLHDGKRVIVRGESSDARPAIAAGAVYVAPIRMGSGTRVKILEALAMGKAVVSTSVGCEGLDVVHGEHLLVADGEEAFAAAVGRLLEDRGLAARLGRAGRELVRRRYDYAILAPMMDAVYEAAVGRAASTGRD
jgi:glycosyltransferase involved in cell wall biosynthesis